MSSQAAAHPPTAVSILPLLLWPAAVNWLEVSLVFSGRSLLCNQYRNTCPAALLTLNTHTDQVCAGTCSDARILAVISPLLILFDPPDRSRNLGGVSLEIKQALAEVKNSKKNFTAKITGYKA